MSLEDLYLGVQLGILAVAPILGIVMMYFAVRRMRRFHVWMDLELKSGRIIRRLEKPRKGWLDTKWGAYAIHPDASRNYKNRPLFRYLEDYIYPLLYTRDRVPVKIMKDGKEVMVFQESVRVFPTAPSATRVSAYLKDQAHSQVYGRGATMELLLMIVVVLVVIGLLVNLVK